MTTLKVEFRPSYGNKRFYPMDETGRIILSMTSKKCFDLSDLKKLEAIGFKIETVINDELLTKLMGEAKNEK